MRRPLWTFLTADRAVELIRREILKAHPEVLNINAVLIDFFLYDLAKERETSGKNSCKPFRSRLRSQVRLGVHWISCSTQASMQDARFIGVCSTLGWM